MVDLLILGASGLVGGNALKQALADPKISAVIAPTRSPLASHRKLTNPVSRDLDLLLSEVAARPVTAVLCAIGTTIGKAGSREAFRHIDYEVPLSFARGAYEHGATSFALVSAIGASPSSHFFFARIKGELERDIRLVGFTSLTIVRPSIIGGQRGEFRFGERVALGISRVLGPVLPRGLHVNPAERIAEVLLESISKGAAGTHIVYSGQLV